MIDPNDDGLMYDMAVSPLAKVLWHVIERELARIFYSTGEMNGILNATFLGNIIGRTRQTVTPLLQELVEHGYLVEVGRSNKGIRWEVREFPLQHQNTN